MRPRGFAHQDYAEWAAAPQRSRSRPRRGPWRLAEAKQELFTLVADMREVFGPQNQYTLEAEAVAARLRHAKPDGAAAGAAELRAVVDRMTEFLGAAHPYTVKWQRVIEAMSADS